MDVLFQITRLKIDSNPFAKGFRDSGRVRLVHDKGDCFCAIFEMSKPPPPPPDRVLVGGYQCRAARRALTLC